MLEDTLLQPNDPHHQSGSPQHEEDEPRSGVKVIGITIILLLVLAVLYWGGRRLLAPEERPSQVSDSNSILPYLAPECSLRQYFDLQQALDASEVVCMINLHTQNLTQLPSTIGELPDLVTLDLRDNQLSDLPDEVGTLSKLIAVALNDNDFTQFPPQLFELTQLEFIRFTNNSLTELPSNIGDLSSLRILDVRGNPLPASEIERVRQVLPNTQILF